MQRYRIMGALAAVALSTGLMTATTVQAADRAITVTAKSGDGAPKVEQVAYSDLDLTDGADLKKLEGRVKEAIKRICAADNGCEKRTWRAASMQIDRAVPVRN